MIKATHYNNEQLLRLLGKSCNPPSEDEIGKAIEKAVKKTRGLNDER